MRRVLHYLALILLTTYIALLPGSSLLVSLNLVPTWGTGFGSILLLLQGSAMLGWLAWRYGRRGVVAGLVVATLGFLVEYIGETTGFPFGRYQYTDLVQPKLFGVVPLAICAAWMMTAAASFEIARTLGEKRWGMRGVLLLTATLVLLLDLQIETVAALINGYWVWIDSGPYYGVPTANFVAWWLVGFAMAAVLWRLLGGATHEASALPALPHKLFNRLPYPTRLMQHMPVALYLLSTGMFTIINFARGYLLAGLIGLVVLFVAGGLSGYGGGVALRQTAHQQYD